MIIVPNKAQTLHYIPRVSDKPISKHRLHIWSDFIDYDVTFDDLEDKGGLKNYVLLTFDVSALSDGEYNYCLDNQHYGIMRIGDIPTVKNNDDDKIIEYNG